MNSNSDVEAFLTACYDEDERTTEALFFACKLQGKKPEFYGAGGPAAEAFWERFDPARMLRSIEAGRKRLAMHSGSHECPSQDSNCGWVEAGEGFCDTLLADAEVFSDRPGYDSSERG